MRIRLLLVMLLALSGCGANDAPTEAKAFDLEGSWLYLGPSDVPHTLTVDRGSMSYADVDGQWSSRWAIKGYDNDQHHFQVVFSSGSGAYLPVGSSKSGAYDVGATLLTVQLSNEPAYPPLQGPGTCTSAVDGSPVPECRLYVRQN